MTDDVKSFDKHHIKFRDWSYESDREKCNNLIKKFSPALIKKYNESKAVVNAWDDAHFRKKFKENFEYKKMGPEVQKAYETMKTANSLIKHFKISQ